MRYKPLPAELFTRNRNDLIAMLPEGSVAILSGGKIIQTSADGTLPFRQDPDFYYLTGIDQEDCALIIWPGAATKDQEVQLFIPFTDEKTALWDGKKLNPDEAQELSGISSIHWLSSFNSAADAAIKQSQSIFLNANEHTRAASSPDVHSVLAAEIKEGHPLHKLERLAPHLHKLRSKKKPEEIEALAEAAKRIGEAWLAALPLLADGKMEYELEAAIEYQFKQQGSRWFSFSPIVAAGKQACVLHYIRNDAAMKAGETVLFDIGTEYANYASDLTRVAPVSGTFSPRQAAVTTAVVEVQDYAFSLLKPGVVLREYQQEVGKFMADQLHKLGLIDAQEAKDGKSFRKYFPHGTSHHLGLDVHDVAAMEAPLQEGAVLTVEPGIYNPEEGIGVRIENDVVLQKEGLRDLMEGLPRLPEEVEAAMQQK